MTKCTAGGDRRRANAIWHSSTSSRRSEDYVALPSPQVQLCAIATCIVSCPSDVLVAQLVEQRTFNPWVLGSSPSEHTIETLGENRGFLVFCRRREVSQLQRCYNGRIFGLCDTSPPTSLCLNPWSPPTHQTTPRSLMSTCESPCLSISLQALADCWLKALPFVPALPGKERRAFTCIEQPFRLCIEVLTRMPAALVFGISHSCGRQARSRSRWRS